jgi:DNA-binding NarL/FixJ family response regulator
MSCGRATCSDAHWVPESVDVEILRLTAAGLTIEVVGRRLDLSERTVRRRLRALADEVGVDTSIEVVVHAVRTGVI